MKRFESKFYDASQLHTFLIISKKISQNLHFNRYKVLFIKRDFNRKTNKKSINFLIHIQIF